MTAELPREPDSCYVCGDPCRYGERHHQCGAAILRAEETARTPLLAEIERLKTIIGNLTRDRDELPAYDPLDNKPRWSGQDIESFVGPLRAQVKALIEYGDRWQKNVAEIVKERDALRAQLEAAQKALQQIAEWDGELSAQEFFFIARDALQAQFK